MTLYKTFLPSFLQKEKFYKNRSRNIIFFIYFSFSFSLLLVFDKASAQQAGTISYTFLNLPYSAKIGGLGGVNASLYGESSTFFLSNPALASDSLTNQPAISYIALPTKVSFSSATYSRSFNKAGLWSAGLQYFSYGKIKGYDNTGNLTNTFKPNDYAIIVSHVRSSNNFRFGISIKQVGSKIAEFSGSATLFDLGALFIHPQQQFTLGVVIKNIGFQWSHLSKSVEASLPFDLQIGASIKPQYMPFRFSLTFYKLNQWNLIKPNETVTNQFVNNLMRHMVVGVELLINKHINLLFGYNHLRKSELKVDNVRSVSGFSLGLDIKIKTFELIYAYGGYNVAGNANMLTLSVNMNQLIK